jgi:hypothetical protein
MWFICALVVTVALFAQNGRSWHGRTRDALVGGGTSVAAWTGIVKLTMLAWGATEAHPTLVGKFFLFCLGAGFGMCSILLYRDVEAVVVHRHDGDALGL